MTVERQMEPLFLARSYLRRRKFDSCVQICSQMLEKNPYDQCAWFMKAKALTEQVYIDEVEADNDGIAEMLMDDNSIAQVKRNYMIITRPMTYSIAVQFSSKMPKLEGGKFSKSIFNNLISIMQVGK